MDSVADVELQDVRKSFGEMVAVDSVSLRVERGEFFSLLGPSGCGKTTTLRLIAGFEHPSSGAVLIQGRAMGATPAFARNVNTVFQHYALFPHMSVADNVGFGLRMKRINRTERADQVEAALELVRLAGYGTRRPHELSGGQQQRVALARALVNRPAVLLLDEPLGALDLKLRKEMQAELKRLQKAVGITFIYVTHDQEEALTMSDRIAVMSGGRLMQIGTPEEIYDHPVNRFVAEFIGECNFLEGTVCEIGADRVIVQVEGGRSIAALRSPSSVALGERVALSVRPERVRLEGHEPVADANGKTARLRGRVEEIVYRGSDTDILVRVSDRAVIRARLPREDESARGGELAIGADVTVGWAVGTARLLPEQGAARETD
jgi:spermidine/putrescine transport system ATP-binding protein